MCCVHKTKKLCYCFIDVTCSSKTSTRSLSGVYNIILHTKYPLIRGMIPQYITIISIDYSCHVIIK